MSKSVKRNPQVPSEKLVTRASSAGVKSTTTGTSKHANSNPPMVQVAGTSVLTQTRAISRPTVQQTRDPRGGSSNAPGTAGAPEMTQVSGWGVSTPTPPAEPRLSKPTRPVTPTRPAKSIRPATPTRSVTPARSAASSALKTPTTRQETARPSSAISVVEESKTSPKDSLCWKDLLVLLKAAHNPRFCRGRTDAEEWTKQGGFGDSCALIGGFPFVVETTFPGNKTTKLFQAALQDYIRTPNAKNWDCVEDLLYGNAQKRPESTWVLARTSEDREKLCQTIYDALRLGLANLLKCNRQKDVQMIMVKASPGSMDRNAAGYGPFGKMGTSTVSAQHVSKQIFHGDQPNDVQDIPQKVNRLISAVIIMAQRIVNGLDLK